jgi:hypothetical protein
MGDKLKGKDDSAIPHELILNCDLKRSQKIEIYCRSRRNFSNFAFSGDL